jgi:hypothetical protein
MPSLPNSPARLEARPEITVSAGLTSAWRCAGVSSLPVGRRAAALKRMGYAWGFALGSRQRGRVTSRFLARLCSYDAYLSRRQIEPPGSFTHRRRV